jgi:hypothetical protein
MPDDCPDLTDREAATVWGGGRAVHMIKLTATQEITPYKWGHPDEER